MNFDKKTHQYICSTYEHIKPSQYDIAFDAYRIGAIETANRAIKWMKDNGCFSYLQEGSQTIEDIENIFKKAMEE